MSSSVIVAGKRGDEMEIIHKRDTRVSRLSGRTVERNRDDGVRNEVC